MKMMMAAVMKVIKMRMMVGVVMMVLEMVRVMMIKMMKMGGTPSIIDCETKTIRKRCPFAETHTCIFGNTGVNDLPHCAQQAGLPDCPVE